MLLVGEINITVANLKSTGLSCIEYAVCGVVSVTDHIYVIENHISSNGVTNVANAEERITTCNRTGYVNNSVLPSGNTGKYVAISLTLNYKA